MTQAKRRGRNLSTWRLKKVSFLTPKPQRRVCAQFERELTRERMLVGIAKARAKGKYKGRAPTARAKADKVRALRDDAGVRPAEIARQVGSLGLRSIGF